MKVFVSYYKEMLEEYIDKSTQKKIAICLLGSAILNVILILLAHTSYTFYLWIYAVNLIFSALVVRLFGGWETDNKFLKYNEYVAWINVITIFTFYFISTYFLD